MFLAREQTKRQQYLKKRREGGRETVVGKQMMSRFPIVPPECIFNNNRSNHSFLFLSLFSMSLLCKSVRLCCCFYIWIYKYENSLPKLKKKRGEKRSKTNSLIYIVYSPKNKCLADCLYTYVLQRMRCFGWRKNTLPILYWTFFRI